MARWGSIVVNLAWIEHCDFVWNCSRAGNAYGKFPGQGISVEGHFLSRLKNYQSWTRHPSDYLVAIRLAPPVQRERSAHLLSVELFPELGLPTRAIKGSRGMLERTWTQSSKMWLSKPSCRTEIVGDKAVM